MILSVQDIQVDLGTKPQKRVLDKVSFEVKEGEFLSLLGASGAGKSTLLKIIAGILIQDKGTIAFDGESIDAVPPHKRGVGFVFQDMRLFPNMNVEENIAFPCKMAKMPKRERREKARYLLECVQLEGFASRDVASLSGGQQQRVALARALAGSPRVLLLDEPFSGLDESLRGDMRSLVVKLHKDFGITTLMVTHDAGEALEMSDRIIYISEGRVMQTASPEELFLYPASYEIAACFGECSVLTGEAKEGVFRRGVVALPAPTCPEGAARAVVRYAGVSMVEHPQGGAVVSGSVYRGGGYLVQGDIEGEPLIAPAHKPLEPKVRVEVKIAPDSFFVYPCPEGEG